jgi:hypothetical protein
MSFACKDGMLVGHWDVIQDEVTEEQSIGKQRMFGTTFPTYGCKRTNLDG